MASRPALFIFPLHTLRRGAAARGAPSSHARRRSVPAAAPYLPSFLLFLFFASSRCPPTAVGAHDPPRGRAPAQRGGPAGAPGPRRHGGGNGGPSRRRRGGRRPGRHRVKHQQWTSAVAARWRRGRARGCGEGHSAGRLVCKKSRDRKKRALKYIPSLRAIIPSLRATRTRCTTALQAAAGHVSEGCRAAEGVDHLITLGGRPTLTPLLP